MNEQRCNYKFGFKLSEIIIIFTMIAGATAAVVRFEFGMSEVKAANQRTDLKHLDDVEEIKREYREYMKEIKERLNGISGTQKEILRELK